VEQTEEKTMKPTITENKKLYSIIGIVVGLIIISMTLPINKNVDIVSTVSVNYPYTSIFSDPKITEVSTSITAHTLYHLPSLSTGGILTSDNMKIKITAPNGQSVSKVVSIGALSESGTFTIILTDVPNTTDKITIELYIAGKTSPTDTKEVSLT
jgi:hypothetical protein